MWRIIKGLLWGSQKRALGIFFGLQAFCARDASELMMLGLVRFIKITRPR